MSLVSWLAESIRCGLVPLAPATAVLLDGMRRVAAEMRKVRDGDAEAERRIAAEIDSARRLASAYGGHASWVDETARNILGRFALELAALSAGVRQDGPSTRPRADR